MAQNKAMSRPLDSIREKMRAPNREQRHLVLDRLHLTEEDLQELINLMMGDDMNNTTELSISYSQIPSYKRLLLASPHIISVDITGGLRTDVDTMLFAAALRELTTLRTVQFSHCQLDKSGRLTKIWSALVALPNLAVLRLTLCNLHDDLDMTGLSKLVALQEICLSSNHLRHSLHLLPHGCVTKLLMDDNNMGRQTMIGLDLFRKLDHLDLSRNELGHDGVAQVLDLLPMSVRILKLATTWMGQAGAMLLGEWIKSSKCKVKELYVGDNAYGDHGVLTILRGLQQSRNCSLTTLELQRNGMTDRSAHLLAMILSDDNSTLRLEVLDLSQNQITLQGWSRLAKAAVQNIGVRRISATDGGFYEPYVSFIRLQCEIFRGDKFQTLLSEEESRRWPMLFAKVLQSERNKHWWGFGLVFELLRNKPHIVSNNV